MTTKLHNHVVQKSPEPLWVDTIIGWTIQVKFLSKHWCGAPSTRSRSAENDPAMCGEKKSCIVCEPAAGAAARKPTLPVGQCVKSESHLHAELQGGQGVWLCLLRRPSRTGSSRHRSACCLSPQATPDVDDEGFSLRPGDEGDDILSAKQ